MCPTHISKTSPWRVRKLGNLRNLRNLGNIGQDDMMSELSENFRAFHSEFLFYTIDIGVCFENSESRKTRNARKHRKK